MTARGKLALWVAVLFGAGLAVPVATGVAVVAALAPPDREIVLRVLDERVALLVFGAMTLLALCGGIARWFVAA
ncbi:MAG: hypothetical protein WBO23_02365, partial [Burkholderiales bacterium]